MKRFMAGVLVTLAIGAGAGGIVAYSGAFDVSADTPHSPLVFQLIEFARVQSIARRVRDLAPPANLPDPDRVRRGAGNYAAMCVECHLAPGKENSEIRMGLYPAPPDLSQPAKMQTNVAARQFWIIKHGIKASGMPAWSKGGIEDEAIWDIVAFLQTLPTLTADQYVALVESSDGHSHGGQPMYDEKAAAPAKPAAVKGGHDHPDGHAH
jgi:mono/diheme cytochrome c family protein